MFYFTYDVMMQGIVFAPEVEFRCDVYGTVGKPPSGGIPEFFLPGEDGEIEAIENIQVQCTVMKNKWVEPDKWLLDQVDDMLRTPGPLKDRVYDYIDEEAMQ